MTFSNCFEGKTVLITGHTGFKGSWLASWLLLLGARVVGASLSPNSQPSHFNELRLDSHIDDYRIDIRDEEAIGKLVRKIKPDFVFHLAAQALVHTAYSDPLETWNTNVLGTLNILESLRKLDNLCVAIIITSDKCYDNVEWVWGYRETDVLGGTDPYSASKGAAELAIRSHVKSYFSSESNTVFIASARAGNVIGGGDWSGNRLIPD